MAQSARATVVSQRSLNSAQRRGSRPSATTAALTPRFSSSGATIAASASSSRALRCWAFTQRSLASSYCAAPKMIEVEPLQELLTREDLVVAVAPTQTRQVVHHGIGQVACVAVLRHWLGALSLAHLLALLVEHGGQVGVDGRLLAQGTEDIDLARRVVHMVVAADHVGDLHVDIVHHQ